jgi:tripartite-type tricarboxylate transporter receptor subunit TctC
VIAFNVAVGPAGVAPAVLDNLSADIRAVVASPQFAERTRNLGIDAWGNSPADAWMRTEIAKWAQIARDANIKPE